jgi:osmoprotectant transport system permease protein
MTEQLALLPGYLTAHIQLVVMSLTVCWCISVPLGVLATRSPGVERVAVAAASVLQTVPALALLAIMVPLMGAIGAPAIGLVPALLGLTLYTALPILLSTITGIQGVDRAVVEAARGVGMTDRQLLRRVELPLALPYIVAGTRTAAVWSVGMATLSTPIGAESLGNFIFGGLQTGNHAATLVGCGAAAALALAIDALVRLVASGLRERRRTPLRLGLAGLLALGLFTGATLAHGRLRASDTQPLRVGAKSFTESLILGHLLAARAQSAGARAEVVESLGSSVIFDALARGNLDAYVDYAGTLHSTVLGRKDRVLEPAALLNSLRTELERRYEVVIVAALGFENTYCLAVREEAAARHGWSDLSALGAASGTLAMGADYEFFSRPEWTDLRAAYGFGFREQRSMDPTLMYRALRDGHVDVISAFSTDGRIAAFRLRVLEDDRHVIPPYQALVLVHKRLLRERTEVVRVFRALEGRIDAATMRELNRQVDELGRTPRSVARTFTR